jgi:hypothetical protein
MSCHRFEFNGGHGIITLANVYQFKGFTFEWHDYLGPAQLRKDGGQRRRISKAFWPALDDWLKLSKKQREKTRIAG